MLRQEQVQTKAGSADALRLQRSARSWLAGSCFEAADAGAGFANFHNTGW
jgi:hypothetical protein